MDLLELGKGILCIAGMAIYFKFFNKPLFDKEDEEKAKDENYSENDINSFKFAYGLQDFISFLVGVALFILGIVFIYNELSRNFGWELLFVYK